MVMLKKNREIVTFPFRATFHFETTPKMQSYLKVVIRVQLVFESGDSWNSYGK